MANVNKEICEIIKKCTILLLDIEGTTTSISFVKDKLFPYAEENVKDFLDSQWDNEDVKEVVGALKKLALEDKENSVDGVVAIPGDDASKDDQIEGLVKSVKWQMSADRKAGPLKQLQGLIWKQGYDKGDIKGHVYDDVAAALEQWRSVDDQKVYIYSSGSVQAQKLLFGQSLAGDLLRFIDGHFDTAVGAKQEAASYTAIVDKIGCKSDEILFLTDIVKEGEAARASGLQVALVSRSGNAPLSEEATAAFPVLHSFAQLTPSNKRKPDPQVQDEIPAKVPKTDTEDDVKTAAENNVSDTANTKDVDVKEPEKMEVEEENIVAEKTKEVLKSEETKKEENKLVETKEDTEKNVETIKDEINQEEAKKEETTTVETKKEGTKSEETKIELPKKDDLPMQVETVIEEVTDLAEIADIPVCDIEPVVEENEQKTEPKETDQMETDSSENVEAASDSKAQFENKKSEDSATVAEETAPTIITEIDEMSNDKQSLSEVAEIIDNLEPVVEESTAAEDMEELQNVGEVLEKECDEILSKVHDVTNLNNIPLKPLLNTIAEENMETENIDSNDIVDRILDTELELEMKKCGEIDLNTVQEMSEDKSEAEECKSGKDEVSPSETKPTIEEKPSESTEDEKKEEKVKESSPAEKLAEETKVEKESVEKSETETLAEQSELEAEALKESKESSSVPEETKESEVEKSETEVKETHLNGKTTNGDAETSNLNGDSSKDEELSSRLSIENGKDVVNGSNGNTNETEQGEGDKVETEVSDIKVKTVATDEKRNDPIEQPTEA